MIQKIGCEDPHVNEQINQAVRLAAQNRLAGAIQILTDLVADYPAVASARAYLGWFLSKASRSEEAIEQSRRAIELEPTAERVSLVHFHVLWEADRRIEALDEMKRFLLIGPSDEYANIMKEWEP